jgi:hypothetical protein
MNGVEKDCSPFVHARPPLYIQRARIGGIRQAGTHRPVSASFSDACGCAQMKKDSLLETLDSIPIPSSKFLPEYQPTEKLLAEECEYGGALAQIIYDMRNAALLESSHLNLTEKSEIRGAYRQLNWALRRAISQEDAHKFDRVVFLDAIRDALVIGTLAGDRSIVTRIESVSREAGRETVRQVQKSSGARGGAKSGQTRRAKAEATWIALATKLIIDCRRANKGFSQDDVASDVASGWKDTKIEVPGHKSLKSLISNLEERQVIPKMKRVGKRRVFE